MPNIIEIVVTGKNATKPAFDEAARQGRAIGQDVGDEFSKGMQGKVGDAIPAAAKDSLAKTKEPARKSGTDAGEQFTTAWGDAVRDSMPSAGERAGFDFTDAFGGRVRQDLPPKVEEPLNELPPKARVKGQQTGDQFSQGMSPLLIGAFTAAATIGPAAILAGVGTAAVGAAALLAKSNAQVAQDYQTLGQQIEATLAGAVSPITGDVDAAVNVLEQGVTQLGPQLDKLFATAGPDAVQLASGLTQLATGALPGITQGIASMAPQMHAIAGDLGKIGQGIGGFIGGLGAGASGGTTAFNALSKSLSEILPDLGQIIGYLSNGLGPALADVLPLISGAAKGVDLLVGALNPGEIQAAALALGGLFAIFKGASWAGLLADGTKFTQFLGGTAKTSAEAEGALKSMATKGVGALGTALDVATGPLGMLLAGIAVLGPELGNLAGVGDHTAGNVDALASAMSDAANGSAHAQGQLDEFANAMVFMGNVAGGGTAAGLKSMDDALTKLYQANPQQAASEFTMLSKSLEANHVSADQVAKDFPQYTQAVQDAALQSHLLGSKTDQLTTSLLGARDAAQQAAQKTADQTLAALGAVDGQDKLNVKLDTTISEYETAAGKATAYKTALDTLYGRYQDYSQAQATFTTDMDNAAKSLTSGKDAINLNTAAGAQNFTLLSQLATQNENVAEALLKQTGNQDAANQSLKTGAEKIDALAKSAHFSDQQIAQLNTDLYGTANIKDISVTVSANTAPAYKGVDELLNFVNSSGATIHVYENANGVYNTGMSAHAKAAGGAVGAAAFGGAHGSWTRLNEDGIEALNLPFGTQVIPAANVNAMAGGQFGGGGMGVGGGQKVQIEFVGDFFELIREHVRVRGGPGKNSVQVAFGQTY